MSRAQTHQRQVRGANQQSKLPGNQVLDNRLLKVSAVREPLFRFGRDLFIMRADGFGSPAERDHVGEDECIESPHCAESTQR